MKKHLLFAALVIGVFFGSHVALAADNFVPLTNIPAVTQVAQSDNLAAFFNNLYRIAIGVAATLAVLQIMRAGIMWMSAGGSGESISKARTLIGTSLFGLLLILSPAIVFGIINPKILSMDLNFGSISATDHDIISSPWESTDANAKNTCTQEGGVPTVSSSGTVRCTPAANSNSCSATPFTPGVHSVTADQQTCCTVQTGCKFQAKARSQYVCTCEAPQTTTKTSQSADASAAGATTQQQSTPTIKTSQSTGVNSQGVAPEHQNYLGPYSFDLNYTSQDRSGNACLNRLEEGSFLDIPSCKAEETLQIDKNAQYGTYSFNKMCTESNNHTPPTPVSNWDEMKNLPSC